jgi:hypothetical protein
LKDIELKTKHIETLEENVRRMNSRLKSEEQARLVSDSLNETSNDKLFSIRHELKSSSELIYALKSDLGDARNRSDDL